MNRLAVLVALICAVAAVAPIVLVQADHWVSDLVDMLLPVSLELFVGTDVKNECTKCECRLASQPECKCKPKLVIPESRGC